MRLSYRYTKAYAIITFFVLSIGFTISYIAIKRGTTQSAIGKLENLNQTIARQIQNGGDFSKHPTRSRVTIKVVAKSTPITKPELIVEKKYEWDNELQTKVDKLFVSTYHTIRGVTYQITANTSIIITDDIYLLGIIMTFAWIFVFLMAVVIILSELLSRNILSPFNHALNEMQEFQLNQNKTIELQKTKTQEFKKLNRLLVKMTTAAKKDYTILKEFTEHASHELQTPLASIKAKIESMIESDLNEHQLGLLSAMHDELERLSKINSSLVLLAKLEHYDFIDKNEVNMSVVLTEVVQTYIDLIRMKGLELEQNIEPTVFVNMDESLVLLLLKNLISNATRHNVPGGKITVELTKDHLEIRNTGNQPSIPTEELFGRFKKGNQSINSIGIGLAIVKKISTLYKHQLNYTYEDGWHVLEMIFNSQKEAR